MKPFSSNKLAVVLGSFLGAAALLAVAACAQKRPQAQGGTAAGPTRRPAPDTPRVIPKTWDDDALASLELPLADPKATPVHVPAAYYYRLPVRKLYKSYNVYAPGREPPGYLDRLKQTEPVEIATDFSQLRNDADWIAVGEAVFQAPIDPEADRNVLITRANLADARWYQKVGVPITKEGIVPFARYVIRKKGAVELGSVSCAMCHTRVLPDGTVLVGAQGNFPFDRSISYNVRALAVQIKDDTKVLEQGRLISKMLYGVPWLKPDPSEQLDRSLKGSLSASEAIPPGVLARHGTSPLYPVQVLDLIGVQERKYLDRTGLVRHRGIGDLMRYAALNQGMDSLNRYGAFIPGGKDFRELPDPANLPPQLERYSDEQLYALAKYVYALKPPQNPNPPPAALAAQGKKIFERERCTRCHEPPAYTNNHLTPARGFDVPAHHFQQYDIVAESVDTDPGLATQTRRGTGYYKVPSLKGVWYRGPFEHNGSVATLEDWFDPRRHEDNYVPTGFRGHDGKRRGVKGHPFGLKLSEEERRALIAFLKTL